MTEPTAAAWPFTSTTESDAPPPSVSLARTLPSEDSPVAVFSCTSKASPTAFGPTVPSEPTSEA